MPATNAALASGGMTHCFCRCGRRRFFLASARSCCRWLGQRSSVPRPALPAVATSTACDPSAVWNRLRQSASLRRRRQRCAVWPRLGNACGQARHRNLLPPVAGGSEQRCRRWYRGRRRFRSPAIIRQSPTAVAQVRIDSCMTQSVISCQRALAGTRFAWFKKILAALVMRVYDALARVCWKQWASNRRPASMPWRKTATKRFVLVAFLITARSARGGKSETDLGRQGITIRFACARRSRSPRSRVEYFRLTFRPLLHGLAGMPYGLFLRVESLDGVAVYPQFVRHVRLSC